MYFAYEDEKINAVLADVQRSEAAGQPATATTGGSVILSKLCRQTHAKHIYITKHIFLSSVTIDKFYIFVPKIEDKYFHG